MVISMDPITESLALNAPGILGVIVVVVIFIRYLERRDQLFLSMLDSVTKRLEALEALQHEHITLYRERGKIIDRIDKTLREKKRNVKTKS